MSSTSDSLLFDHLCSSPATPSTTSAPPPQLQQLHQLSTAPPPGPSPKLFSSAPYPFHSLLDLACNREEVVEARASIQHPHPHPSDDIGWDWAIYPEWPKKNKIKCTLCGHESTGGIFCHKGHLTSSWGNTKPCKKATPDIIARVKAAMTETKGKKSDKIRSEIERRQEVDISRSRIERSEEITQIGNKRPREFGSIHRYAPCLPEEPTSSSSKKQTTVDAAERKKRRELVHE